MNGTYTLILSGTVSITAGGSDQVLVMLTETQLRSLAHHAMMAVTAIDEIKEKRT